MLNCTDHTNLHKMKILKQRRKNQRPLDDDTEEFLPS